MRCERYTSEYCGSVDSMHVNNVELWITWNSKPRNCLHWVSDHKESVSYSFCLWTPCVLLSGRKSVNKDRNKEGKKPTSVFRFDTEAERIRSYYYIKFYFNIIFSITLHANPNCTLGLHIKLHAAWSLLVTAALLWGFHFNVLLQSPGDCCSPQVPVFTATSRRV